MSSVEDLQSKTDITKLKRQAARRETYLNDRDRILGYNYKKIKCSECGCKVTRSYIARHRRTKKCLKLRDRTKYADIELYL